LQVGNYVFPIMVIGAIWLEERCNYSFSKSAQSDENLFAKHTNSITVCLRNLAYLQDRQMM